MLHQENIKLGVLDCQQYEPVYSPQDAPYLTFQLELLSCSAILTLPISQLTEKRQTDLARKQLFQ